MAVTDFRVALIELARALRQLHRALVDCVGRQYEREYGPVPGAGGLLHLLANDPYFAWLHPLSELMVALDVLLEADAPATMAEAAAMRGEVEQLVSATAGPPAAGGFAQHYLSLIADDPHVAMAHAEVKRKLRQLPLPDRASDAGPGVAIDPDKT